MAWVATAPMPAAICGTRAPTAKNLVATAMAKSPLNLSRAMIDQVIAAAVGCAKRDLGACVPFGIRRQAQCVRDAQRGAHASLCAPYKPRASPPLTVLPRSPACHADLRRRGGAGRPATRR